MRFLCIAVSALALGAAACGPRTNPALRTRLDCPARQGDLVRASVSADGKSCGYRSGDVEVALQLTPLTGDPQTTLSAIETSLLGPKAAAPAPAAEAGATASAASAASAEIQAGDAAKAAQEAREDAGKAAGSDRDWDTGHGRTVVIDKNGKHVEVNGEGGDQAHIDLPGIHIDANDNNARVDVAGVHVDASDGQATFRIYQEVRLAGHGLSRDRDGVHAVFLARRDDLPGGFRTVGYEAGGPKTGPLTVAVVRSRSDVDIHGHLEHDLRRLVRLNGGA
jgi:hypothetical protein